MIQGVALRSNSSCYNVMPVHNFTVKSIGSLREKLSPTHLAFVSPLVKCVG